MRISNILRPVGIAAGSVLLAALVVVAPVPQPLSAQTGADNTKANKGDARKDAITADKQKVNSADQSITQKIRSSIAKDKTLSIYAHNIKIVTRDGKVTLKGPVRTADEKANLESKAAAVVGDSNVTSEIEITPPKS